MPANSCIRVALLEKERMIRECLGATLMAQGMEVVGSHSDPATFLGSLSLEQPDVALVGLRDESDAAGGTAQSFLREAKEKHPGVPLVVLASACRPEPELCYREGAAAWIDTAASSAEDLVCSLREAAGGARMFPFHLAQSAVPAGPPRAASPLLDQLSTRERQVLTFIGVGADNLKIAAHLSIRERTVKSHVTNLYRKTLAQNRSQLALLARELGLRPPQERTFVADLPLARNAC